MIRKKLVIFFVACVLIFGMSVTGSAETGAEQCYKLFVYVDGIPGDSMDASHTNWIDAKSLSDGLARELSGNLDPTFGRRAARPTFTPIRFTKYVDSASPLLHIAVATGGVIPTVILQAYATDCDSHEIFRWEIKLSNVMVVNIEGGFTASATEEAVQLSYQKIEWRYEVPNLEGTYGQVTEGCWNLAANKDCTSGN